ncbi:MAG: S41 family peptidase [Kofleriaceae bacterium]
MKGVACLVAVLVSCGSSPPPEPPPAAAPPAVAPVAVAKPAEPTQPIIPDTPAGRTMTAWLDAFNSGDVARMYEFADRHKDPMRAWITNLRERTGGFDPVEIEQSQPRSITLVVKEKTSTAQQIGFLRVADGDPAIMEIFTFVDVPPGMTAADIRTEIDADTPRRIVDAIGKTLNAQYVYPALAKKMAQALHAHLEHGDDQAIATGPELAFVLTHLLQEVGRDRHLRVEWQARAAPPGGDEPNDDDLRQEKEQLERIKCGFVNVERLAGNIGYMKFDMFGRVDVCGAKATEAFAALGDVDAIIFDLRDNGGGWPQMVTYVESYLFAKRTHIYDMYDRQDNKTTPGWTNADVPGKKLATQPVYVLTAARTFSAAEAFAYDLQSAKRATIEGEVTGGGAHPTHPVPLDAHFVLMVPSARPINVVTKTDWEGTGVQPDVKVPADQALDKAKQLAADKLAKLRAARN